MKTPALPMDTPANMPDGAKNASLEAWARDVREALTAKGQWRSLRISERECGNSSMLLREGRHLHDFSSNDYLGLSRHPKVIAVARAALEPLGTGGGASRLVSGNGPLYDQLEEKIAQMKEKEAALVFGSGYLAHLGIIPALVGKGDLVLMDRLAHACMVDAVRLSGAKWFRFHHNDRAHLEQLLMQHRKAFRHCLIITETIFSMDGDVAPLQEIRSLAGRYQSWSLADDAHGLGVVPLDDAAKGIDVITGTFSKAAGGYGGYACASTAVIQAFVSTCRSLVYSTALPPATLVGNLAALEVMAAEPERREQVMAHAARFAAQLGLPHPQSAIVPVILGANQRAVEASEALAEAGFAVPAIRTPTVPEGTARLRVSFSADHDKAVVDRLAEHVRPFLRNEVAE